MDASSQPTELKCLTNHVLIKQVAVNGLGGGFPFPFDDSKPVGKLCIATLPEIKGVTPSIQNSTARFDVLVTPLAASFHFKR